jgi:nucleotidyltransferase/DNA polymerase involved in DNA repair
MRRVISLFLPHWSTDRVRLHEGARTDVHEITRTDVHEITRTDVHEITRTAEAGPLVLGARVGSRRVITAISAEAARLGLYPGMAVSQAQAMVPALRLGEADPAGDADALQRLAAWCLGLSPLAAPCAPDGVWIDSTGCDHLQGGEAGMLARLTGRLAQAGIASRAAVADTPGAAHAAARFGTCQVVPPGGQAALLAGLPVRALRISAETEAALCRLGFDRIGQLMAAPRGPLTRRFGASALLRLDQALGRAPEPIEPVLPPDLCRVRHGFPEPIATADDLARVTELLAAQLCEKLRKRDQGASRLDLVFTRVDGSVAIARIGTAAPSRDAAHLTRLLLAQIETIDPGFGVEAAMLSAPLVQRLGASRWRATFPNARGGAWRRVRWRKAAGPRICLGRRGCCAGPCRSRRCRCCPTSRRCVSSGGACRTVCAGRTGRNGCSANGGSARTRSRRCGIIFRWRMRRGSGFGFFGKGTGRIRQRGIWIGICTGFLAERPVGRRSLEPRDRNIVCSATRQSQGRRAQHALA